MIKVFVSVGDRVREGDPLLQWDDRDLRARLAARQAAIPPAQAQVEEQRYRIGDLDTQLKRRKAVRDSRAVSEDDVKRTWYASEMILRVNCGTIGLRGDLAAAAAQTFNLNFSFG